MKSIDMQGIAKKFAQNGIPEQFVRVDNMVLRGHYGHLKILILKCTELQLPYKTLVDCQW